MPRKPAAKKSPASPASRRADALRQQICAAATDLFTRKGYGGTSMQDIADALEVSRPTLYYYFRDKNGILEAAVREVTLEGQKRAESRMADASAAPAETLRRLVADHADVILARPAQFRMIDMAQGHFAPKLRGIARAAQRGLLEAFTNVIRRGIEEGVFRVTDPRVAAFSLIGMCNWTAAWYRPEGRLSQREITDLIADLGVCALLRPNAARTGTGIAESLDLIKDGVRHIEFVLRAGSAHGAAGRRSPEMRAASSTSAVRKARKRTSKKRAAR